MKITPTLLNLAAKNRGGRLSFAQLALLGVPTPPPQGWFRRVIGQEISEADADRLIDLGSADEQQPPATVPPGTVEPSSRKFRRREYVELELVRVEKVTDRAFLVSFEGEPFWVPKALVRKPEKFRVTGRYDTMEVEEWFARDKRMI